MNFQELQVALVTYLRSLGLEVSLTSVKEREGAFLQFLSSSDVRTKTESNRLKHYISITLFSDTELVRVQEKAEQVIQELTGVHCPLNEHMDEYRVALISLDGVSTNIDSLESKEQYSLVLDFEITVEKTKNN